MLCSFSFSFPFVCFFLLLHLSFFSLFASACVLGFVALINMMTESSCYWQCFDRNLILYCQCARSGHGVITSKILEETFLVYLEDNSYSRISAWQRVGVLRKQNAHTSAGHYFGNTPLLGCYNTLIFKLLPPQCHTLRLLLIHHMGYWDIN